MLRASNAIRDCLEKLDTASVGRAIAAIAACSRLDIYGQGGGSASVAEDAKLRFFRLGLPVCAYADGHQQRMSAATLRPKDVAFAVSNSGRSKPVIGAIEIARSYGATTIALTRPGTPLAAAADVVIPVVIPEDANALMPTASRYAHMAVIDTIATGVASEMGARSREALRRVRYTLANIGVAIPSPSSDPTPADEDPETAGIAAEDPARETRNGRRSRTPRTSNVGSPNSAPPLRLATSPARRALFGDECFWRDLVAFTWNVKTLEGRDDIAAMLDAQLDSVGPTAWRVESEPTVADGVVEAWIGFETRHARGRAIVRLKDGRAWTLLTAIEELKGFEERKGRSRPMGAAHGVYRRDKNWLEAKRAERRRSGKDKQPYCVIIGGGQGGIALGARLKQLGVPTIILEKNPRAGNSWRNRYRSLVLHDPVWYDHLPYIPFPENWPVFTPKDKLGDWLEMYAKVMELNFWGSSECVRAATTTSGPNGASTSFATGRARR